MYKYDTYDQSIVDARVARWLKNEGDAVSTGDPLVELETDKVDVEVSATHMSMGADPEVIEVVVGLLEGLDPEALAA